MGPDALVIVGVVENARYVDLKRASPNMAYRPATARPDAVLGDLEIRTSVAPSGVVANVRRTLAEAEPRLPIVDALPLAVRIDRTVSEDRTVADLTSAFGGLALLLACLGLYGTISYGVTRRVSELGLRMALGAERRGVLWMVMREALTLVVAGLLIGVPLAFLAARAVASLLYNVFPGDPRAYIAGMALLLVVAAVAAILPAYRASRIEPMTALGRN